MFRIKLLPQMETLDDITSKILLRVMSALDYDFDVYEALDYVRCHLFSKRAEESQKIQNK